MKISKEELQKLVKEAVVTHLNEAVGDPPNEDWIKFGNEVDDFINKVVDDAKKLHDEGEKLFNEHPDNNYSEESRFFVSSRLRMLKSLIGTLVQKYESMRRDV